MITKPCLNNGFYKTVTIDDTAKTDTNKKATQTVNSKKDAPDAPDKSTNK